MGPPSKQHVVYIMDRLPYYHPPRNRPVTFEGSHNQQEQQQQHQQSRREQVVAADSDHHRYYTADSTSGSRAASSSFLRQNLAAYVDGPHQRLRHDEKNAGAPAAVKMFAGEQHYTRMQLANLPSHNSEPRPFVRNEQTPRAGGQSQHLYGQQQQQNHYNQSGGGAQSLAAAATSYSQQQQQQHPPPQLLLNDQPQFYPTSTVHKSMLRSRSRPSSEERAADTRLISPTSSPSRPIGDSNELAGYCPAGPAPDAGNQPDGDMQIGQVREQWWPRGAPKFGPPQGGDSGAVAAGNNEGAEWDSARREKSRRQMPIVQPLPSSAPRLGWTPATATTAAVGSSQLSLAASGAGGGGGHTGSVLAPDDRREEYMWNRQLERSSIAHQTYRTLPIVVPKPKARHDLATGTYMRLVHDPTWELGHSRPASALASYRARDQHERRIAQAISGDGDDGAGVSMGAQANPTQQQQQQPHNVSQWRHADDTVPAFNYREYIESTRRA